jgi:hypothetical protein
MVVVALRLLPATRLKALALESEKSVPVDRAVLVRVAFHFASLIRGGGGREQFSLGLRIIGGL